MIIWSNAEQMKLICYYLGSDARWLVKTFPTDLRQIPYITFVKIRAWVLKFFVSEYWLVAGWLEPYIRAVHPKAKIRIIPDAVKYTSPITRIPSPVPQVLYYFPKSRNKKYNRWVYGKDIFDEMVKEFPGINFIVVDGTANLMDIYPYIDGLLRCNRHDGRSRMVDECRNYGIPVYNSVINPEIDDIRRFLEGVAMQNKRRRKNDL